MSTARRAATSAALILVTATGAAGCGDSNADAGSAAAPPINAKSASTAAAGDLSQIEMSALNWKAVREQIPSSDNCEAFDDAAAGGTLSGAVQIQFLNCKEFAQMGIAEFKDAAGVNSGAAQLKQLVFSGDGLGDKQQKDGGPAGAPDGAPPATTCRTWIDPTSTGAYDVCIAKAGRFLFWSQGFPSADSSGQESGLKAIVVAAAWGKTSLAPPKVASAPASDEHDGAADPASGSASGRVATTCPAPSTLDTTGFPSVKATKLEGKREPETALVCPYKTDSDQESGDPYFLLNAFVGKYGDGVDQNFEAVKELGKCANPNNGDPANCTTDVDHDYSVYSDSEDTFESIEIDKPFATSVGADDSPHPDRRLAIFTGAFKNGEYVCTTSLGSAAGDDGAQLKAAAEKAIALARGLCGR